MRRVDKHKFVFDIEIIPKHENMVAVPVPNKEEFQVRHDGVLLNSNLYFWEEIKEVTIKVEQHALQSV